MQSNGALLSVCVRAKQPVCCNNAKIYCAFAMSIHMVHFILQQKLPNAQLA